MARPLKFKLDELNQRITAYFADTPKDEWTITGLALALDTSRKVLCDYEGKDKFSNTIKKAKLMIENGYEIDLKKHGRTGTIFALKNFEWKDQLDLGGELRTTIRTEIKKPQKLDEDYDSINRST